MRILVTGGTGSVGRRAVARLVRHGHDVVVIGRRPGLSIGGAEYRSCDINQYDPLCEQMHGIDAIVHLAAIPNPSKGPGHEIFRINCAGSYNVYEAAAAADIRRVVSASSINAFGYNFGVVPFPLRHFPIDEEHPAVTTDPYSFSKQVLEDIADYYWRRDGISGVSLRLPGVFDPPEGEKSRLGGLIADAQKAHRELMRLPESQRDARLEEIHRAVSDMRESRASERQGGRRSVAPEMRPFMFGVTNFWAIIHAEDSAQAIERGVTSDYDGSHPLFVNDSQNVLGLESELLAQTFYPRVTQRTHPLQGSETLVSIDRARQLLDFEPEHSIAVWAGAST